MGKRIIILPVLVILLLLFAVPATAQVYNTQVEAKIILKPNSEFIDVSGTAYNKTEIDQSLRFVLSIIRHDPKTDLRNKKDQKGRLVLSRGDIKNLVKTYTSKPGDERVIILLLVYDEKDRLLGKDRVVLNDTEGDQKIILNKKPNPDSDIDEAFATSDGIELKGLVLEETKTRLGRDFYSKFATDYRNKEIMGPKVVTIIESLALANNTQIAVKVGEDIVMEFFVRPQTEYMDSMEEEALNRVIRYFKNLKESKNVVKSY